MGRDLLEEWLSGDGLATLDRFTGSASDVLGVMDPDYIIRYVNWTAPGLTRTAVVGQSAFNLIPPTDTELARRAFDQVLSTGRPARFEITFSNNRGMIIFVVRVNPILYGGKVIGAFTLNTDVTEERRESVDRDRFFSLSLDMLAVVTPEGKLKRLNPAFCEALGYAMSDLVDRPFADFVHPADAKRTHDAYQRILEGQPIPDFENRYARQDGTYRVFSWRATVDPVTGDVYAVARDITDHRATETQLRHAQKMEAIGQLAGGIAHDFNNLMQAVLANVEIAMTSGEAPNDVLDHLREIETAGMRAAELTKQLLVFGSRQKLDRAPVDLNLLLHGLMKMLRRLLPENIVIDLKTAEQLPAVNADRTQLEQIVTNLCVNARDAMETGGTLTVETSDLVIDESESEKYPGTQPGHFVCLCVTDNGVGMSAEVRERIYEPFFTTKAHRSGTGVGLSTLYGIVQQHGGTVHVESEVDRGSTFRVYLPADHRLATAPQKVEVAAKSPRGNETILIAEDEQVVLKPILQLLQTAGYRTLATTNGREAIELLSKHRDEVDFVVLDVVMPEIGGPEAWERMREMRPDLGVIFMSGYADEQYRMRLPPGAELLDKPFSIDELLRRIRARLDQA